MSEQGKTGSGTYIGIDLGTTYSSVAYLDPKGTPITVPNSDGEAATPSIVLLEASGRIVVGKAAKRALLVHPDRVADCVKRDMGERYYARKLLGRQMSPITLSSLILKKLKQDTEARIGPIAGAVITVPAYFNEARRRATMEAGRMAGLRVIDILNEPTAAALAYAFQEYVLRGGNPNDRINMAVATTAPHNALVYDLGGGTFDATLLRIAGDDLKVLSTDGDMRLGGRDWDDQIVNYVAEQFRMTGANDPLGDPKSHQGLLMAAEEAKIELSTKNETTITITHQGRKAEIPLPRSKFENLTAHLLFRTHSRLDSLIAQTELTWPDMDEILAVGGSSRMPQVLELLEQVTGKKPNLSLPPGEVVAHGAAIHAAICAIGAEGAGRTDQAAAPIRAAAPVPASLAPSGAEEPSTSTGLSELAAPAETPGEDSPTPPPVQFASPAARSEPLPAASPAGKEDGETGVSIAIADDGTSATGTSFRLAAGERPSQQFEPPVARSLSRVRKQDVSAHSLGVVASDKSGRKISAVLIPRNTSLPVTVTQRYGTESAGQTHVKIQVIEGESDDAEECMEVGRCYIRDLPAGLPRKAPVEVTFTYDSSGLLAVRAVEVSSGQSATTTIERASSAFTGPAIDRARKAVDRATVV